MNDDNEEHEEHEGQWREHLGYVYETVRDADYARYLEWCSEREGLRLVGSDLA